ncbi:helix-turn-helix domain-containing protein [Paenibacillus daejeonensis]|uniref:helix-turn-helix domain-containing protein n=1 Tax=Paenibacillus daejeonensis TaxID=135193 RepID=UPI00036C88A9|nr:helix-turn-helix domain-containing protein [Paenibacillus daejeonensis]
METQHAEAALTEDQFRELKKKAAEGDEAAAMAILRHFEPFMQQYCVWIGMPREDAMQSMRLAMLEWIKGQGSD